MANQAFLPVQNLSLQTSALQSSPLVNTFDANVLRVVTGSIPSPLTGAAMPVLDSRGNPLVLSAKDVVFYTSVASSDIVASSAGNLQVGVATGPNVSPTLLATMSVAQINTGRVVYQNPVVVPGVEKYVTARCTSGDLSGNEIKVTLLTLSPQ
jgi:hypothetical protein